MLNEPKFSSNLKIESHGSRKIGTFLSWMKWHSFYCSTAVINHTMIKIFFWKTCLKNDKNLLIKNAVTSKRFLMEKENGKLSSKTEMFKELNFIKKSSKLKFFQKKYMQNRDLFLFFVLDNLTSYSISHCPYWKKFQSLFFALLKG